MERAQDCRERVFNRMFNVLSAASAQQQGKNWIPSIWEHTELRKMDAWVNEKCGPSDASGIQGFVHETDDLGSNWKVHIFCRIEHSNKIKWTSKNNRGMQEPGNLKDMLRAIQAGDLAIVGNVRGLNNTTILVLEKDQQEP
jgi:hypothetical protein